MYAMLLDGHWFNDTPGWILTKCHYLLKAAILQALAMHQLRCSDCHWASLWKSEFHWASKQRETWPRCRKWEYMQLSPWNRQNDSIKASPGRGQDLSSHSSPWKCSLGHPAVLSAALLSGPQTSGMPPDSQPSWKSCSSLQAAEESSEMFAP